MSKRLTLATVYALATLAPQTLGGVRSGFVRNFRASLQQAKHEYNTQSHLSPFRELKCPDNEERQDQYPEVKEDIDYRGADQIGIDIVAVAFHLI